MKKHAIGITREENFADWYLEVVREADLAEHSGVRGCMIIKPWGYAIWERIQRKLDELIKATGHLNCYFPVFIPIELIQKEAGHVSGFAKEMAVVTHHRLIEQDGHLVPAAPLDSPLVIRPTSETMIGEAFARWISSYRDLPLKINQWGNAVRWEMRPRLFLRTTEFLWQEGHTAHATREEAIEETHQMLSVYREVAEGAMKIPVISGEKTPSERFPGADATHSIEAMMQDGRALQAGTSHFLGQNFSRAANIRFQDSNGETQFAYTTSWGASTRLVGAMIMTHGDDDGLRLPPRIAPYQVVILPIVRDPAAADSVISAARALSAQLANRHFADEPVRSHVDLREESVARKRWEWIKKGVPLICELGPRDLQAGTVEITRRDRVYDNRNTIGTEPLVGSVADLLSEIEGGLFGDARAMQQAKTRTDIHDFADFSDYFKNEEESGFVLAKWSGDPASEAKLVDLGVTIRCIPYEQSGTAGRCVLTGKPATIDTLFAKSY